MITGRQIRAARRLRSLTQLEFSDRARVSPSTIVKIEGGARSSDPFLIKRAGVEYFWRAGKAEEGGVIVRLADRRPPFRKRDPTKWFIAILIAFGLLAALIAMNRYL
jgi:transcriptional regulator with XRE-family HTH domain